MQATWKNQEGLDKSHHDLARSQTPDLLLSNHWSNRWKPRKDDDWIIAILQSWGFILWCLHRTCLTSIYVGTDSSFHYMWCDLGKSVWSRTCDIFNFLFDWNAHLERYILLKTPPESDQWFQSYEQLKNSKNNRKLKKFIPFSGYLSLSMLPTFHWFCRIVTHNVEVKAVFR